MITITIRINNHLDIARSRRPIVGSLAAVVASDTLCRKIDATINDTIREKLTNGLRSNGVDARIDQVALLSFRITVQNTISLAKRERPLLAPLAAMFGMREKVDSTVERAILEQLSTQINQGLREQGVVGQVSGMIA